MTASCTELTEYTYLYKLYELKTFQIDQAYRQMSFKNNNNNNEKVVSSH